MDINYILGKVKQKEDIPLIQKAYDLAHKTLDGIYTSDNRPMIEHLLGVTDILLEFNADTPTIISNLLYKAINLGLSKREIRKIFGKTVVDVSYSMWEFDSYTKDNLGDIMSSLNEGGRVMFIKLAKRLYDMQRIKDCSDETKRSIANNTLEVIAPAGRKLHFAYISSKLEDLSLYYLEPEIYNEILNKIGEPIEALRDRLNITKEKISKLLADNNIEYQIKGRIKTFYSLYNKLSNGKKWEDIYDILAIRIVVENKEDCSKVMDLIHSNYEYIPSRFKNYIDNPKDNMYQSLHSTILDDDKKPYEVQVRTRDMDKTAESGSASHLEYKEKQFVKSNLNKKISN